MSKYFDFIVKNIIWKKAVLLSLPFVLFNTLINFSSFGVPGLLEITGGPNILDFEFCYDYEAAYKILTGLGIRGREFYLARIVPIDIFYPLSYMLIFTVWIALLLKHLKISSKFTYLLCAPPFAMIFDWIENIGIIIMLKKYPNLPKWAVFQSSSSSLFKFIFTLTSMAIIVVLLILYLIKIRKIKTK